MNNPLLSELKERGLIASLSGNLEELLKTPTTFYVGTDPTADSLHLGHLLAFTTAKLLQKYGHKPIVLLGGATAFIGDPSFKSEERKLLSAETVAHNIKGIHAQVSKLLDFDSKAENGAIMVNNYDWMKNFSFIDFAREVGKCITVNYMMAKDSVKKRLEREGSGMSFTEFTYQLIQGYDFVELYKKYNCKLQIGGSDQFGNGTTGSELIRKMLGKDDACILTWPLVTKSDGTKFGKSEKGNIWLDAEKTSPYEFYQFWLNQSDEDSERFIKLFTLIPLEEINALIEKHREQPSARLLQKELAKYMTCMVHSEEAYNKAIEATNILFGKGTMSDIEKLDEKTFLSAMNDVPKVEVDKDNMSNITVLELAAMHDKVPSKTEARKLIKSNGFSINKSKVLSEADKMTDFKLINDKYLLLQKGKKDYTVVVVR
jgi:tyrosyl-tRNA synthetase